MNISRSDWKFMMNLYMRLILLVLSLVVASSAQAHKVNMFAFAEGNEVYVEGYFSDGKKPKRCEVIVYDENNKPVFNGLTNEDGQISFTNPVKGAIRITLNAGEGHMAEYKLSAEETMVDEGPSGSVDSSDPVSMEDTVTSVATGMQPENADIQKMIRHSVGQSLRPVMRALDELKARRGTSDIIGGVGIIMGIGGLLLYMKARKLSEKRKEE